MTAAERLTAEILELAQAVALQECEAVEHGQRKCPEEHESEADYCLPCAARAVLERRLDG